jgi:hypothetical protein
VAMNKRDIVIGVVVLTALAGLIYFWQNSGTDEDLQIPQTLSVEDKIEDKFNLEIPEDVEKTELKDAVGGDASGIVTRKVQEDETQLMILADLPDPETGKIYNAMIIKDDETKDIGFLQIAKGGYLLEYQSGQDLSDYKKVEVKLDETTVLEGEF